ncbi:rCG61163 [Rattus norvegicus]|uniref:RCG61163 n=1 Tax=Rattus norvegicus TaxID=10116 RepID=A6KEA6_RAT|nr:rCG61163 [Rattus norvegicus]
MTATHQTGLHLPPWAALPRPPLMPPLRPTATCPISQPLETDCHQVSLSGEIH